MLRSKYLTMRRQRPRRAPGRSQALRPRRAAGRRAAAGRRRFALPLAHLPGDGDHGVSARTGKPVTRCRPPGCRRIAAMDSSHHRVYSLAHCYDVAFNFRDIGAECDALTQLAQRHGNGPPRTVLELAAGPARHAREWARRGMAATALDSSATMYEYALTCATRDGVALRAEVADMVDFSLGTRFDLALMPIHHSSCGPASRAAGVGCGRVVAGPMEAAWRQGVTRRRRPARRLWAGLSTPNRSQPASKDRFKRVGALCSDPVLPCSGCRGEGKRAFEKPILHPQARFLHRRA